MDARGEIEHCVQVQDQHPPKKIGTVFTVQPSHHLDEGSRFLGVGGGVVT